jgi:Type IV secretion system pilin
MNKKTLNIIYLSILAFLFLFTFSTTLADSTERCAPTTSKIKLQVEDWPKAPIGDYTLDANSKLPQLVGYFFGWGIGLGGLAVFIALIIAGVEYITSIADPSKLKDAKDRIKSSLIGLVLLLSSWAIFSLINPNLTKLTEPPIISNKNGVISELNTPCSSKKTCCEMDDPNCDTSKLAEGESCPQVANPSCNPKYWACCRSNDLLCLAKGEPITPKGFGAPCVGPSDCISTSCSPDPGDPTNSKCASGKKIDGATCADSSECTCPDKNNCSYCKSETGQCAKKKNAGDICNRDIDCINGTKCQCDTNDFQKKCVSNPLICNMVFDQEPLGCDVVRFYSGVNFTGKSIDFKASWIGYTTTASPSNPITFPPNPSDEKINAGWIIWQGNYPNGWGNVPQSYQAFAYQKDGNDRVVLDNNNQPALLPCGELGCGCTINRCITVESGGTCNTDTSDKNTGAFLEYAYSPNTPVLGARINDKTKQGFGENVLDFAHELDGGIQSLVCSLTGIGCN